MREEGIRWREERKRKERRKKERKREKRKERNKGKKMTKTKREEENMCMEEKKKERKENGSNSRCFVTEVDKPRIKVGLLDESYELVPKTKEVEFSPTLVPLNLRVVNGCVV